MEILKKQLIEYIENKMYNYAFMITGEWGAGKSYFINEFIEEYEEKKVFIKISLNSLELIEDIDILLIEALAKKIKNKTIPGVSKASIIKQINYNNILHLLNKEYIKVLITSVLDVITDNINPKNVVLIFDDLERCKIDITNILGYISNYVEKQKLSVIIIANEEEIKKNDQEDIYLKIKEKIIGQTIEYVPDIKTIYNQLIKEKELKSIFEKNESSIIEQLIESKHINMRTMQFILDKFTHFYDIVFKDFSEQNNIELLNIILKYITIVSIMYKEGRPAYKWGDEEYGYINPYNDFKSSHFVYGFKFIDPYIYRGTIDIEYTRNIINIYMENLVPPENPYDILRNNYWELEDKEVYDLLNDMLAKMIDNTYKSNHVLDIILLILILEESGYNIEIEKFMNAAKKILKEDLKRKKIFLSGNLINFITTSQKTKEKYILISEELKQYISEINLNELKEYIKQKNFIGLYKCLSNQQVKNYILKNGFFKFINIEELLESIKNTDKVIELSNFRHFCYELFDNTEYIELYQEESKKLEEISKGLEKIKINNNIGRKNAIIQINRDIKNFLHEYQK